MRAIFGAALALLLLGSPAHADPYKDESGKGWRGHHYGEAPRRYSRHYRIPRGHLPPPGECRVWYPGRPSGHQPPPFRC